MRQAIPGINRNAKQRQTSERKTAVPSAVRHSPPGCRRGRGRDTSLRHAAAKGEEGRHGPNQLEWNWCDAPN